MKRLKNTAIRGASGGALGDPRIPNLPVRSGILAMLWKTEKIHVST
jgi:hypothetical protein